METAQIAQLAAIPLISAATGYLTNRVAVRMLFRPQRECRFLGLRLQGLIPRRRIQIADKIGETVERHLVTHDDIRQALENPDVNRRIRDLLDARVSRLLDKRVSGLNPLAKLFVDRRDIASLKRTIMDEIMQTIPPMTGQIMDTMEEHLNFRQIVVKKIEEFDLDTFEEIILRIASRELRAIEILGGVLGFIIGLVTDVLLLF